MKTNAKNAFKKQLLKWIGNKQRYANEIISFFPDNFKKYHEPFLGSKAVLATLAPDNGIGYNIFPPLIEIFQTLKHEPELLKQWYNERWYKVENGDRREEYEKIKASYNLKPNGADLLYLSRSCYGGVVRFRNNDGHMSTPCGIHKPIKPDSFSNRVDEWKSRVNIVNFMLSDYRDIMENAKGDDLIYCDPPYSHTQSILYGAQKFKIEDLFSQIERCKSRGVYVVLSIDGIKKSGQMKCDLPLPPGLFEREALVDCGRSMLKRFQMEGKTLEEEHVKDRLLLKF